MSQRSIYYYFYYWDYHIDFPLLQRQLCPFILCFGGHNTGLSVLQMCYVVKRV